MTGRGALLLAALVLVGCGSESPTLPTAASPSPSAAAVTSVVIMAPAEPRYTVRLIEEAALLLTSNLDEPVCPTVVWQSAIGGTYREAFCIPPRETVLAHPDCFYTGHYDIRVGDWQRSVDYPPGVPYCF